MLKQAGKGVKYDAQSSKQRGNNCVCPWDWETDEENKGQCYMTNNNYGYVINCQMWNSQLRCRDTNMLSGKFSGVLIVLTYYKLRHLQECQYSHELLIYFIFSWTTTPGPGLPSLLHIHDAHTEFIVGYGWSLYKEVVLASCT